jgi:hypothetical protein
MAQVVVRQLDAAVIEIHRRQARVRGVSLEQELRKVITRAGREVLVRRVDAIRALTPATPPGVPPRSAEELIREDRDRR